MVQSVSIHPPISSGHQMAPEGEDQSGWTLFHIDSVCLIKNKNKKRRRLKM